jgi:hypothetical protein
MEIETKEKTEETQPKYYNCDEAMNEMGFGPFQIILLFICGFFWLSDAMEVMIISFLGPIMKKEWGTEPYQQAILNSVVFFGM